VVLSAKHRTTITNSLAPIVGEEEAEALMAELPLDERDELVTKGHLDLRLSELDVRFAQIDGRFAQIDGRFAQIDGRFDALRGEMGQMRGELIAHIESTNARTIRWLMASQVAMAGILVAGFAAVT